MSALDMAQRIEALERRAQRTETMLETLFLHLRLPVPDVPENQYGTPSPSTGTFPIVITKLQTLRSSNRDALEAVKSGPCAYRPLDASRNEVRILVLLDERDDTLPIKFELLQLSLDKGELIPPSKASSTAEKTPEVIQAKRARIYYAALSYTWGDVEKKGLVFVNGHRFPVTRNLEAGLRHMRKWRRPPGGGPVGGPVRCYESYWWIDAICINQVDITERNQQVSIMRMIYKNATSVQIWLGEEADESRMAMDVVRQLSDLPKRGPGEPEIRYPDVSAEQKLLHWRSLTALFQRQWFERVWVRQEVAVAAFPTVHCGDKTHLLYDVLLAAERLNDIVDQLGFDPLPPTALENSNRGNFQVPYYLQACLLAKLRQKLRKRDEYMSLTDLVFHTRTCKATDLRDKVFSIIGLADPDLHGLKPNYRLSLNEALKTAAHSLLLNTKSLDFLSGCQNPERKNELPSWVPNLADNWKAWPLETSFHRHHIPSKEPEYSFDEGTDILRLTGGYLDSINLISTDIAHQDATAEQLHSLISSWRNFVAEAPKSAMSDAATAYVQKKYMLGRESERAWIELLSIGHDDGHSLVYSEEGELLPKPELFVDHNPAIRLAESLLLPDRYEVKGDPYRGIYKYLRRFGAGRRLVILSAGWIGLAPGDVRHGDLVCQFNGATVPYVLRKHGEHLVLVGEICKLAGLFLNP